eukprot:scpid79184/ scgid16885/ 
MAPTVQGATIGPASQPAFPISAIIVVTSAVYILAIVLILLLKKWCQSKGKTISCPRCPKLPGCCDHEACTSETGTCAQAVQSVGEGCGCRETPKSCKVCWIRYCPSYESCRCNEFHSCGCFYTKKGKFTCPCPTCPTESYPACPSCPELPECPTCCEPSDEEFQCPEFTCPTCPGCPSFPECHCQCQMPQCEAINCFCCEIVLRQPGAGDSVPPSRTPAPRGASTHGESITRR